MRTERKLSGMKVKNTETDILYIVIPAYNERDNIEQVIEEWYPVVERHSGNGASRLVIINDGSKDDTLLTAKRAAAGKSLAKIVDKRNGGHGQTVMAGYLYAIESGADYIFQTDSDRQTSPKEFEGFWRQRIRYDAVIGNRFLRQDGFSRLIISKLISLLVAAALKVWIKDANTPYRLMKSEMLRDCIHYIEKDEPIPNIMLSAVFKRKGYKVLYKDIEFKNRQAGRNSIDLRDIYLTGRAALARFIRLDERLRQG